MEAYQDSALKVRSEADVLNLTIITTSHALEVNTYIDMGHTATTRITADDRHLLASSGGIHGFAVLGSGLGSLGILLVNRNPTFHLQHQAQNTNYLHTCQNARPGALSSPNEIAESRTVKEEGRDSYTTPCTAPLSKALRFGWHSPRLKCPVS